jgi:erythronate-4-phosphate dehydrogenase
MLILADENIPFAEQAFAQFGTVKRFIGRELTAEQVQDAELLLVRSVTRVNAQLLNNSRVQFVASATTGTDHIDLDYLKANNIVFAHAPGSNAISAAEYVTSALLILAQRDGFDLRDKQVGIIGCGNVGSRVLQRLHVLGVECVIHDPPLQAQIDCPWFVDRQTVLKADIITLHLPLVRDGDHPTLNLADADFVASLKDDAIFINTARGDVMDQAALKRKHAEQVDFRMILDVWENEPEIDRDLLQQIELGTPHIAGYSYDGKIRGTAMIHQAACQYFGVASEWDSATALPEAGLTALHFSQQADIQSAILYAVTGCYDIRHDDAVLRHSAEFDHQRKHYWQRREFSSLKINSEHAELSRILSGLGFQLDNV